MCGIAGFVGESNPDALERMVRSMAHRGPDGSGTWSDGRVHLGHSRLAVIDPLRGGQPMVGCDGSTVIVFNGEVYDHSVLRAELEAKGHRFRTRSDTEVVLAAFEVWGERCVERLHGMFAFVIVDLKRRVLFGARDRFGKKPLYYTDRAMGRDNREVSFAFASEMTALCQHPVVSRETSLSIDGVIQYLLRDAPTAQKSIRRGIYQLPPASLFVLDLDSPRPTPRIETYWRIDLGGSGSPEAVSDSNDLVPLLDAAVKRRLVSDVPLGLLLSGGIDSASILAMMARHRDPREINTFSIGFEEPSFDETEIAVSVARRFGTRHHHEQFRAADLLRTFRPVIARLDEPLADPSIFPTAMLSRLARQHVKVALSGEGGDEIFAGYDPIRAIAAARWYRRMVPRIMHRGLVRVALPALPKSETNMSLDFKMERFLRAFELPASAQMPTWLGSFSLHQVRQLMPDYADKLTPESQFGDLIEQDQQWTDEVNKAIGFFQRAYLPEDILRKVDRASMMHSLEVRCPMLDTELAEWANRLPPDRKFRRGTTKWILKQSMAEGDGSGPILPDEIIHRRKKGFGIPVAKWLRCELRSEVQATVLDAWPEALGAIDRKEREAIAAEHFGGRRNRGKELWSLLVLGEWVRAHL